MKRICPYLIIISVFFIMFFLVASIDISFEPELLLPILNLVFVGALLVLAAFFSAKIYLKTNLKSALYMCCGMLVYGVGSALAGWIRFLPDGANDMVTVLNVSALASSLFHFLAAYREDAIEVDHSSLRQRKTRLITLVSELSAFLGLLVFAVLINAFPVFLNQNGFTVLRQLVLWFSIVSFFAAAVLFYKMYQRKKTDYFFWYSAALAFITLGLIAFCVVRSVGDPETWLGRVNQYIGGICAILSMQAAVNSAKQDGEDLPSVVREYFTNAEEIYTNLADVSENAIISADQEFRIFLVNAKTTNLFGYKKSELIGSSFLDLIDSRHRETIRGYFEAYMESGSIALPENTAEADAVRKDGGIFPVKVTPCIYRTSKRVVCTYMIRDITDRKNAEEALAQSENLLKTVIADTPDLVFLKNMQGRFVLCNQACAELFGRTVEEMKGISDYELYKDPEMARAIIENDRMTVAGKESQVFEEAVPGGRVFLSTKSPWTNAQGNVIGVIGISRDITDRRRSEEELILLKNELSAEVRSLNVLYRVNSNFIIQNDLERIIRKVLGAAVFLTNSDKGCLQLVDDDQEHLTMIIAQGLSDRFVKYFHTVDMHTGTCGKAFQQKRQVIQIFREAPDSEGKPFYKILREEGIVLEQSMPLIASSGRFVGVINIYYSSIRKVTERESRMLEMLARIAADKINENKIQETLRKSEEHARALVEELRVADRNKNEFLDRLSHELRNPLAVIVAGLSLLDSTDDKQKTGSAKEIIRRQIDQLCHLVDDLLDLTRVTNNKIVLKKERVELNKIVLQTAEEHRNVFVKKDMQLETALHAGEIILNADPVRLKQIIGNLLQNAVKFSDAHTKTTIQTHKRNGEAVIRIKDNGIGIEPAFIPELFKPFKQAENLPERTNGGLGLGLAVVKSIAELHGGNVSAESKGTGTGAEFIIRLPVEGKIAVKDPSKRPPFEISARSQKILLIEENQDLSDMLGATLEGMGYAIAIASGGREGMIKAKEMHPEIILCDIGLADLNGYEIAKKIKGDPKLKDIHMIALSGYAGRRDVELAIKAGFDRHIAKPVEPDQLRQALTDILHPADTE